MLDKIDIDKLKLGDIDTFRCFFDLLFPKLMSLGTRFLPESIAEDMVQDVFAMYWEQKSSIDADNLQSYLYKTLQNKCLNYIKRQEVEGKYSAHLVIAQARLEYMNTHKDDSDIFKQIAIKEFKKELSLELNKLSPRVAQAFRLCYFEDLTHVEVADIMNISVRTAETYIYEAISLLRKNIRPSDLPYTLLIFALVNIV